MRAAGLGAGRGALGRRADGLDALVIDAMQIEDDELRLVMTFIERHLAIRVQLVPVPQAGHLSRREVDIAVVLEKPEAARFVAHKLTDYAIGLFASADYLRCRPAPERREDLAGHALVGYAEEFSYSPALDYVAELCGSAPIRFQCASVVTQLQVVRAGAGIGALHDFIARRYPDLARVLSGAAASRTYWLVKHEDTRSIGRIRAVHDFIVDAVAEDRAHFRSTSASSRSTARRTKSNVEP